MIELRMTFQAWLQQQKDQVINLDSYSPKPLQCREIPICYDDDEEECSTPLRDIIISKLPPCIVITPVLSTKENKDSLITGAEHLDTIPKMESDEFIKSSVENLVPNPSESEDGLECDVPVCDDFTTFSNLLFDADDDFSSNPHHFNAESDHIESLLNQDSSIISSSKIDSLLDEFVGELILLKSIPPRINEADCDLEEEIRLIKELLYENLSPRPPEEFNSENSDAVIESFSPSPIPVEDSDPIWRILICFLLLMDQYPQVLIVTTRTPKGIIFFQKDCCTMILFPFWTFLTSQMSSGFSSPLHLSSDFFNSSISRSEDTIFDPGIFDYHFSYFMPGGSHRSGTFMKFNVYPNHLNKNPMEILSSTCSPIDK
nr:hypothetical protein [Tanacetum cinerariifolium]